MKQNKFKIIIPSYNNEKWLEPNLASILNQRYTNYEVLYIDDCSTDETFSQVSQIVGDLPNWKIVRNESNMRRGYNLSPYNPLVVDFMEDDEEILLFVDGDDWLYEDTTLEKINQLYNEHNYWMTYGSFICYPTGDIGNPQNTPYPEEVHAHNAYRKDTWRASHLRTFKWHLYKQIKKEDLIFSQTGEFYFHAEDLATSFPCLEMCPKHKIGVVPFLTYVYNVSQEARDRVENDQSREPRGYKQEVAIRETEIRNKEPYKILQTSHIMTNVMSGGLGNMMFQIAAGYALAKVRGHKYVFNPQHVGTLHKHPVYYKDSIFKNIATEGDSYSFVKVQEKSFTYNPLPTGDVNIILDGYFQSYKYFEDSQKEIQQLFSFEVPIKYDPKGKVSVHVRRGNYTQLSDHHHNLDIKYYINAFDFFRESDFLVFSDDIDWCKEHFIGDRYTFVEGTTDIEDLYLMSQCEHNIIANSTFSWWGAFLNRNPHKVVVYPDKWFGPANSEFKTWDLFPPEWICLTEEYPRVVINLVDSAFTHLAKPNGRYSSVHDKIASKVVFTRKQQSFPGITIFTDQHLIPNNYESKYRLGWLLETREVNPDRYDKFEEYANDFDFIMTHDKELLKKYPEKTRFTIFGGTWIKTNNYGIHPKTKNISMIYSDKQQLSGHKLRHQVAQTVTGVDLYGRGTPRFINLKEEALLDYRFSIVIENSKVDNYFTEKLVDCLVTGTVPIYWGCPNLENFFDLRGIIVVNNLEEIQEVVATLDEKEYIKRTEFIKKNLELAMQYTVTEDWMYDHIFKDLK